jgi:hypothetical protein
MIHDDSAYLSGDDFWVCSSCFDRDYVYCSSCGEPVHVHNAVSDNNGSTYCRHCADDLDSCSRCGELFADSSALQETVDGDYICTDCAHDMTLCEHCNRLTDYPTRIASIDYCDECRDDIFTWCEECRDYICTCEEEVTV